MKHLLIIGLLLVPTMALAQQAPPELNFKFTPQETDVVWEALRELPVKRVDAIMNKMRQQVMEQNTPKAPVEVKEELKKD